MKPSGKKLIFLLFGILFLLFVIALNQKLKSRPAEQKTLRIQGVKISVEVASNSAEKSKGLSGRKTLGKNEGMLFVFAKDTQPSFWMKDMNFSIDIIWINDGKIVQIDKNVPNPPPGTADSQLPLFSPNETIDYVLEVNAGFSEKNIFQVGDPVDLSSI